jgi:hypothetical protein
MTPTYSGEDIPTITRRTFVATGAATLAVSFLAIHSDQLLADHPAQKTVTITDPQLATSGFALSTLTDPAKRQRAINSLFFCWANLSQAKPSDKDRVTEEVNRELSANRDLGEVFGQMQGFLNDGNFFSLTDEPIAGELYRSLPLFTGLFDAPLGAAISYASDFATAPDYGSVPPTRLDALGTIALAQVQSLLDVNDTAIASLNQSGFHVQLGLDFGDTRDAAQKVAKIPTANASVAQDPAGKVDVTKTLSNIGQATVAANHKFSDDFAKAKIVPDPATALKIAKEQFEKQINEIRGGVSIAAFITGTVFGDAQAAKVITTAGTAAVNITSAIGLFEAGTMGPLGLASSLLGGVQMLSSLFGGEEGPVTDQLILQGLNHLSSQITSFWKDMDSQLSLVEKQQSLILDKLQDVYAALFTTGQVLGAEMQTIEGSIMQLSQSVLEIGRSSYQNSLQLKANDVAQNAPLAGGANYLGIYQNYGNDVNEAYTYATSTCLRPEFTGSLIPTRTTLLQSRFKSQANMESCPP